MGLDLAVGELDDHVAESWVVVETGTASQRVHIQWYDRNVLYYLDVSMLGLPLGVGAIADDMSDGRELASCRCCNLT